MYFEANSCVVWRDSLRSAERFEKVRVAVIVSFNFEVTHRVGLNQKQPLF